jgi:hypothetical protein
LQIDGRDAVAREYLAPHDNAELPNHVMILNTMWDERITFSIMAYGDCTCTFDENRADIDAIIQSVRLHRSRVD